MFTLYIHFIIKDSLILSSIIITMQREYGVLLQERA